MVRNSANPRRPIFGGIRDSSKSSNPKSRITTGLLLGYHTEITLTRDQSALLSMFRVDSMTSIITYFSQGFSTPVEAPRAQKHGPKSLGPKNQWHGC